MSHRRLFLQGEKLVSKLQRFLYPHPPSLPTSRLRQAADRLQLSTQSSGGKSGQSGKTVERFGTHYLPRLLEGRLVGVPLQIPGQRTERQSLCRRARDQSQ